MLLFQRIAGLFFDAPGRTRVFVGTFTVVVVLTRGVQDGRARVKAAFADTNVLGVLLHFLDVFIVLPPIHKSGYRA